ncbi:MAG: hypothetical protein BM562_15380 [Alphaproteobacteria bacterium MedPE-SWcel]|nr:MAG: hypothetical protein BM562_15380 [Alphaproteobacteria bacterium MedPE-SWcel]
MAGGLEGDLGRRRGAGLLVEASRAAASAEVACWVLASEAALCVAALAPDAPDVADALDADARVLVWVRVWVSVEPDLADRLFAGLDFGGLDFGGLDFALPDLAAGVGAMPRVAFATDTASGACSAGLAAGAAGLATGAAGLATAFAAFGADPPGLPASVFEPEGFEGRDGTASTLAGLGVRAGALRGAAGLATALLRVLAGVLAGVLAEVAEPAEDRGADDVAGTCALVTALCTPFTHSCCIFTSACAICSCRWGACTASAATERIIFNCRPMAKPAQACGVVG